MVRENLADYFLFCGSKETELISFEIIFGNNKYVCELEPRLGSEPTLFFKSEKSVYIKSNGQDFVHCNMTNTIESSLADYAKKTGWTGQNSVSYYVHSALTS